MTRPGVITMWAAAFTLNRVLPVLRLDGHSNIAAANRHHARDPQRTLKLLQTA
jgi:hypothetical protein